MPWSQNYAPLGSLALSALVASLPVVSLLGLLAFWHVRAHIAALVGLAVAMVVAIAVYHMPWQLTAASAVYGAAFGLFPIGWIVLNAIFIYQLSVDTGQFEALKGQIAGLAGDKRIQALLIAFAFGAFIEGCAGFGAPVAITGAMMIGLGFKPLEAAKLALIGNTAPVAFGSLGIPLVTLSTVTGLDVHALSAMAGRQLPMFSCIVPFWLIASQWGWRGMMQVWPACLVCGVSFAIVQFLVSNYHGPWLVDIAAALVSIAALVLLLKVWHPEEKGTRPKSEAKNPFRAWLPWVALSICVAAWKIGPVEKWLNDIAPWKMEVPALHNAVEKTPPVAKVMKPGEKDLEPAIYKFNLPAMTGSALLLAGVVAGLLLGKRPMELASLYLRSLWRVRVSLITIALMLALGYVTKFSGTDCTMGLLMAGTGWWFPFFSPMIGWLGVALTGSDTSSNVLFGNLQKVTAQQLDLSPILTAASNSSGGVMGKMIDAQSIVVASVATGGHPESPDAGTVLRAVFWHSLALALLVGVLVMAQAYLFPWMIVEAPVAK
jgi:lactate permease